MNETKAEEIKEDLKQHLQRMLKQSKQVKESPN